MKFVGVDLHKKSITLCVMVQAEAGRQVVHRQRFACSSVKAIREFFEQLGPFRVAVEATSNYEWFLLLIEDLADRYVLVHPRKMRVIAESCNKSDKVDAFVLAEFLLLDKLPEAWRPSPRVMQHRVLVRHRRWLDGRITSIKCKLRNKLAHYNSDIAGLFSEKGREHLANVAMNFADRHEVKQLEAELELFQAHQAETDQELAGFAKNAPQSEREAREILDTIPQVGPVTIDAVLSELGDWRRFGGIKQAVSYAGLNPGHRKSDGKVKNLPISKQGSRILRWALIQAAWRLANNTSRWKFVFDTLMSNTGSKKKAIVGVARRLLGVMFAMLRDGKRYDFAAR